MVRLAWLVASEFWPPRALWGAFFGPPGGPWGTWGASGSVLDRSGALRGAPGGPLGCSWALPWAALGGSWSSLERSWGLLGGSGWLRWSRKCTSHQTLQKPCFLRAPELRWGHQNWPWSGPRSSESGSENAQSAVWTSAGPSPGHQAPELSRNSVERSRNATPGTPQNYRQ